MLWWTCTSGLFAGATLFSLGHSFADVTEHVEVGFGKVVVFAIEDALEALDGVFDLDVGAGRAGEDFGHMERLGQEALDAAGAGNGELVLVGEFVHAQNGDDVLKLFVLLEHLLHAAGDFVVLLADNVGGQDARGRVERIHGGVDAQLGDLAGKNQGAVEVGEGRGRRGVGQVVSGNVDGLDGGDGALRRGGDAFLQGAEVGAQGGLVTDGGRHAAEKGGHFGAGLGEAEDVVDEEEHVLVLLVAEVFSAGEGGQGHAGAGAGGLVHLAVDQGGALENASLGELVVHVVAFTGTLANTGEHGVAAVRFRDVVDHFHEDNGLAHAGAAEEAHLAALGEGHEQVDDLDAGLEELDFGVLLGEFRGRTVDGVVLFGVDRAEVVHGTAEDVHDAADGGLADGNHDGMSRCNSIHAANESVRRSHGDAADRIVTEMLCNFHVYRRKIFAHWKRDRLRHS